MVISHFRGFKMVCTLLCAGVLTVLSAAVSVAVACPGQWVGLHSAERLTGMNVALPAGGISAQSMLRSSGRLNGFVKLYTTIFFSHIA